MKTRPPSPALALFFLSPLLGELVSGHQAPLEFIGPLSLAITIVPYGCGALAARELVVRCRKGWLSLVLMGLAFGLVFEGLVTRVIFNPNWEGLGVLARYGRAHGVNWVLAVGVVHFQAVVSIVGAALLAEMLYPRQRSQRWIGTPALIGCCVALPGWTLVLGALVRYAPPLPGTLALIGVAALLIALALRMPEMPFRPRLRPTPPPWVFFLVSGVGMTLIMTGTYVMPHWAFCPPPAVTFVALSIVTCGELAALTLLSGAGAAWSDRHQLAMIGGFLAFFLVLGVGQDLSTFAGRGLVSVATIWLLHRLWVSIDRRERDRSTDRAAESAGSQG